MFMKLESGKLKPAMANSYQWKCISSRNPKSECFPHSKPDWNQRVLSFSATLLHAQLTEFVFTFRVRHGAESVTTSQVLQVMAAQKVLSVNLLCTSCYERVFVAKHDRVTISSDCTDCTSTPKFEWQLWMVLDGNENLRISQHDCVQPDGSTFYLFANSSENALPFFNSTFSEENGPKKRKRQKKKPKSKGQFERGQIQESRERNISEGFAGEAGSAAARDLATALAKKRVVATSKRRKVEVEGFVTKQWISMHISDEETVTGLNRDKLVIKPDVLKPGRTYVVILEVHDSANVAGRSMQEISMFAGPRNGRCLLHPSSGYEYSTNFKLDCLEWVGTDPNVVLFYELGYTLRDSDDASVPVRYGPDNNFEFALPAGLEENDHDVYLKVAVVQKLGGPTEVCTLSVKVEPLSHHRNASAKDIIDEELGKPSSDLRLALGRDDVPGILNRIHVFATLLNSGKENVGAKVRQVLLGLISALNVSTEEEALQMLAAVNCLMESGEQFELSSLETACGVVRLADTLLSSAEQRSAFGLARYRISLSVLNSLSRSLENVSSHDAAPFDSCRDALGRSVDRRLGYFVAGEPPLRFSAEYLNVEATCLEESSEERSYSTEGMHFRFLASDRFCAKMITHTSSTAAVVTTRFVDCDGSELDSNKVRLLSPVDIDIPAKSRASSVFGTFYQDSMEAYDFVVGGNVSNRNLIVKVRFEEDLPSMLLLVSSSELPCTDDCILRRKFVPGPAELVASIAGDEFSGGGNYRLGMVRADYDSSFGEKRRNARVDYALELTFVECVQRNTNKTSWISDGCSVRSRDAWDVIACRCDKLTDYSARVYSVPRSHRRVAVGSLSKKRANPSVPAVLVLVVLVFGTLVFVSMRKSSGRVHVCGRIWLKDNSHGDGHAYLVTVQTGYRSGAGTSSSVFVVLHGENGASDPRELYEEGRRLIFNRGATNSFFVTTRSNLGAIWKVELWHSCSGRSPSWFLDHVIVEDAATGGRYYFECEKWLAVEDVDGKVETELLASEKPVGILQRFRTVFRQALDKATVWSSLYERPPCDHFTHSERILACLANLTGALALAAVWCRTLDSTLEFVSYLDFVQSGMVSGLFGFVLQILAAVAFQRTKLADCKKSTVEKCRDDTRENVFLVLPVWFRYAARFTCCVVIWWCIGATLWIAWWFPAALCLMWLLLAATSIALSSCILLPIAIAAFAMLLALTSARSVAANKCICGWKCRDEVCTFSEAGSLEAKKRLRHLRYARPPQDSELGQVRKECIADKAISSFSRKTVGIVFVLAALLLVASDGRNPFEKHFEHFCRQKFGNATLLRSWLTSDLHSDAGGAREYRYVDGTSSILVGVVRLREPDVGNACFGRNPKDVDLMRWLHGNVTSAVILFSLYNVPTRLLSEIRIVVDRPSDARVEVDSVRVREPATPSKVLLLLVSIWKSSGCVLRLRASVKTVFALVLFAYVAGTLRLSFFSRELGEFLEDCRYLDNVDVGRAVTWNKVCNGALCVLLALQAGRCLVHLRRSLAMCGKRGALACVFLLCLTMLWRSPWIFVAIAVLAFSKCSVVETSCPGVGDVVRMLRRKLSNDERQKDVLDESLSCDIVLGEVERQAEEVLFRVWQLCDDNNDDKKISCPILQAEGRHEFLSVAAKGKCRIHRTKTRGKEMLRKVSAQRGSDSDDSEM